MQLIGVVTDLQLIKKVPVIFHNLRGYDSHLIFQEFHKFDVKIDVMPNKLEKYMAFLLKENLVFIGSIQLMNSMIEKLVKNLSENDFKYLTSKKNWNKFDMKNVDDYHDHYLKNDVLLLTNVFEKLIDTCL